jgi:hypothetical protein
VDKNAPQSRGVTVTGTELGITIHQWNAAESGIQGVYFDSIRVI